MVKIGDRYRLPVTYGSNWKGEENKTAVGQVIALYPRFAVVAFPHGVRECYPFHGPQNIA